MLRPLGLLRSPASAADQLLGVNTKRDRYPLEHQKRWVSFAGLDPTEIGLMNFRAIGKLFLAELFCSAKILNI